MTGPRWARLVASAGGAGFSPRAPGTVGTLVALPFGWALLQQPVLLIAASILVCAIGLYVVGRASGGADHGWIVIDEVAGLWITLIGLVPLGHLAASHGWPLAGWLFAAFLVFRGLDIAKPGPIGAIDRRHDSLGVMGDDMLAGALGACMLLGARLVWEWVR